MRQRLDLARTRGQRTIRTLPATPMMVIAAARPGPEAATPPVLKPEPHPGMLKGILNGLI
jgi:hypothetical protein